MICIACYESNNKVFDDLEVGKMQTIWTMGKKQGLV